MSSSGKSSSDGSKRLVASASMDSRQIQRSREVGKPNISSPVPIPAKQPPTPPTRVNRQTVSIKPKFPTPELPFPPPPGPDTPAVLADDSDSPPTQQLSVSDDSSSKLTRPAIPPKPALPPKPSRGTVSVSNSAPNLHSPSSSPLSSSPLSSSMSPTPPEKPEKPEKPPKPTKPLKNSLSQSALGSSSGSIGQNKPVALSSDSCTGLMAAFKKLTGSTKQLVSVCALIFRSSEAAMSPSINKADFQDKRQQLDKAREQVHSFNNAFNEKLRAATADDQPVRELIVLAVDVTRTCSLVVAAAKAVLLDVTDDTLFKNGILAITTTRDALQQLSTLAKQIDSEIGDRSQIKQLSRAYKNVNLSHSTLLSSRSASKLVADGKQLEIEACGRAAVAALMTFVRSFKGPIRQEIVTEAKVLTCCIAQMVASLNDTANNPSLLVRKDIRAQLTSFGTELRTAYAEFMELTKKQVLVHDADANSVMLAAAEPLRLRIRDIVASFTAISKATTTDSGIPSSTDSDLTIANDVVTVIELVPPPPKEDSSASAPKTEDRPFEDIENIWDEPEDSDSNIMLDEQNQVKCATINKLVERLTSPTAGDVNFMKTFLTTYRSYTTPETLLNKLIQRYHAPERIIEQRLTIQLRVCNVFKHWVETQIHDFTEDLIEKLRAFLEELSQNNSVQKFIKSINDPIAKAFDNSLNNANEREMINLTIEPKIPLSPSNILFVFDEEELARQLALVDFSIYEAIQPVELLNQAWNRPKYKHRAPNVLAFIQRATNLTWWVASVILWQATLKERVRAMTKIINIAEYMRKLNNFNAVMAIISGLNTSSVYRLKHTRDKLTDSTRQTFANLEKLMDCNQAYSNYRSALHTADPPCIPFLGVYLTDLTFIEDGNPDYRNGLINFKKGQLVYNVIREVQQYQQMGYKFELVSHIAHCLTELPYNKDEQLYDLSLLREPRGANLEDIA